MNETVNLHLPQWEASDRIHHDDFNDAMEKLDAAARIVTGSYIGTGAHGSAQPNSLDVGFTPKLAIVALATSGIHTNHNRTGHWENSFIWTQGQTRADIAGYIMSTEQTPVFAAATNSAKSAKAGAKGYAGSCVDSAPQSTWQA